MKVGDLVKMKVGYAAPGLVMKIDKDHYGARQAYKVVGAKRGECLHPKMVNTISLTEKGIRDRVLVFWHDEGFTYEDSIMLEVISESR